MQVRRVVTGRGAAGTSIVTGIGPPPRSHAYQRVPGLTETLVWATDPAGAPASGQGSADDDPTPSVRSYVPAAGGTRLIWLQFPPDAVFADPAFDPVAARAEQLDASPGLAERFELDAPGMHATPTVDYAIVVDGELWLELDDGQETPLRPGDVVVQRGTRHAWRNHGTAPATLAVMLIGVDQQS